MAIGVIDLLKLINIHHDHASGSVLFQLLIHPLFNGSSVVEACKPILLSQLLVGGYGLFQLLFCLHFSCARPFFHFSPCPAHNTSLFTHTLHTVSAVTVQNLMRFPAAGIRQILFF